MSEANNVQSMREIKIVIEAANARQGGGQTYLHHLLRNIPDDFLLNISVIAPETLVLPEDHRISRLVPGWPLGNPFLRAAWLRWKLPKLLRNLKADVLFCPGGVVATRAGDSCRTATMFRNMLPFDQVQRNKYPRFGYQRFRNWLLHGIMLKSMTQADLVIFLSNYARKVIQDEIGKELSNGVTIPHGISDQFRVQGARKPAPDWLPVDGYFLYVSNLDYYKSQIEVVQAYAALTRKKNIIEKLILIGPDHRPYGDLLGREILRLGLNDKIIVAGKVPYDELPAIYQNAKVNIFASQTENCPNILLELLAAGQPVLCSNMPPMPEFGADAVAYADPRSPVDLCSAWEKLIDDSSERARLAEKAQKRSEAFSWRETGFRTWNEIVRLVGNARGDRLQ